MRNVKLIFYTEAESFEKENKETPASRIVLNYKNKNLIPRLPIYMAGPVYYAILKYEDKQFYLFSDIHHSTDFNCEPKFSDIIPEYLGKLDKIVDVFYEGSSHYKKRYFPERETELLSNKIALFEYQSRIRHSKFVRRFWYTFTTMYRSI